MAPALLPMSHLQRQLHAASVRVVAELQLALTQEGIGCYLKEDPL